MTDSTPDPAGSVSALPGADLARLDALAAASAAGLPPGWLLYRRVDHCAEGTYRRWTAGRGFKPCVWAYLPLKLGLRSTLAAVSLEGLRAEAWRQEWLAAVYLVNLALTGIAARRATAARAGTPG